MIPPRSTAPSTPWRRPSPRSPNSDTGPGRCGSSSAAPEPSIAQRRAEPWSWTSASGQPMHADAGDWEVRARTTKLWSVRDDIFRSTHRATRRDAMAPDRDRPGPQGPSGRGHRDPGGTADRAGRGLDRARIRPVNSGRCVRISSTSSTKRIRSSRRGRHGDPGVFLSYSSRDRGQLDDLLSALRRADEDVWFDEELGGGEQWWQQILERIRGCDVFLFALSDNSLESQAVPDRIGLCAGAAEAGVADPDRPGGEHARHPAGRGRGDRLPAPHRRQRYPTDHRDAAGQAAQRADALAAAGGATGPVRLPDAAGYHHHRDRARPPAADRPSRPN